MLQLIHFFFFFFLDSELKMNCTAMKCVFFFFFFCSTVPSFSRHVHGTIQHTSAFGRRIYIPLRHPFIPSKRCERGGKKGATADDQTAGMEGGWVEEHRTGEERKKVAKCIKRKISHLSRSVWQLEAPFHNVMHTIMHAQCGGHCRDAGGGGGG